MRSWRARHEWPATPTRVLLAEIVTCPHCGTLRVVEEGKPTRYLRRVGDPAERDREDEPPCIAPPEPRYRTQKKRDRIGCEITATARERALRAAIDRDPERG